MTAGRWRRIGRSTVTFVWMFWSRFTADHGPLAAAGMAFYILLTLIPLLLLLVSAASFLLRPEDLAAVETRLIDVLGPGIGRAVRDEVLAVVQLRGLVSGLALLLALWAGSQVFLIIAQALNEIREVEDRRPFWVLRGLALLMVPVTGVLILLAVALGYLITLAGRLPVFGARVDHLPLLAAALLNVVLPWMLVTIVFALLYRFLPARPLAWRYALPGAVVAGAFWVAALQLFSWYTFHANYSFLYGSLGGLVLLMLWFNLGSEIFLLGAELAKVLEGRSYSRRH